MNTKISERNRNTFAAFLYAPFIPAFLIWLHFVPVGVKQGQNIRLFVLFIFIFAYTMGFTFTIGGVFYLLLKKSLWDSYWFCGTFGMILAALATQIPPSQTEFGVFQLKITVYGLIGGILFRRIRGSGIKLE